MGDSWEGHLTRAAERLDAWDLAATRAELERGRSAAKMWGSSEGAALADILEARTRLLIAPAAGEPLADQPPESTSRVANAYALMRAELALATGSPADAPPAPATRSAESVRAWALYALQRFEQLDATPPRIPGAHDLEETDGWALLVRGLDAEANGQSGWEAFERAREQVGEDRALVAAALRASMAQAARRGACGTASELRARLVELVERWLVSLPLADAQAARARPDRAGWLDASGSAATVPTSRLLEVALALGQERDTQKLVDVALDAAVADTHAERGILLLAEQGGGFRVAATRFVDAAAERQGVVGLSSRVAQRALASGEVVVSDDVRSDRRLSEHTSLAMDVTSVLCVPILARAEIEGAIYLDRRRRGRPFDAVAAEAARAVGGMLASALASARTVSELESRSAELERAREQLSEALEQRTVERDDVRRQLADVRGEVPAGRYGLVGTSPAMLELQRAISQVAPSDAPVLITGETGSGKELVARAIHQASARRDRPFVAINCGALSEALLESELFGVMRGAYTSAVTSRPGLFVAASGGTLLLDEVGDMPPAMQITLLRVLETGEIRPVGGTRTRRVDVRVLASTHKDLSELEQAGSFRSDLRYRLEVLRVNVPPLRARLADLAELSAHLLDEVGRRFSLPKRRLSPKALEALAQRSWPGNVRELRHVLARAALSARAETINVDDVREGEAESTALADRDGDGLPDDGHRARADAIERALRATAGHRGKAAELLGISRSSLYRYLEQYGIDPNAFEM